MTVPEGYGYEVKDTDAGFWPLIYMFMNHRNQDETATVQYKVVVDSDPLKPVEPYWFDVENCQADPIYNVPGGDKPGSTDVVSADYTFPSDARIIGGGGHVHGGAKKLTLTQPDCNNRKVGESFPTWGLPSHPFYNVRPILHEPGPINMSAFGTEQGIPVEGGTRVRLNSLYDNERPHTRVMGIFVVFVDENPGTSLNAPVNGACASLPTDTQTLATDQPGRRGAPPPFKIPLTGLDTSVSPPHAIKISAPPGKLKRVKNGATIEVGDRFFSKPNVEIRAGAALNYKFTGVPSSSLESLHNLTLATGPFGIGSPNLDGGRVYKQRFKRPGTYRFFCGLHPTQMQQRVVVEPKARKGKGK